MNPQTYTNAGVLLQGQVQQSPTRPAASALWWAANGAGAIDPACRWPVAGNQISEGVGEVFHA